MNADESDLLPEPLPPASRGWRTGDLVRAAVIVFTVWFAFRLVWSISTLVFLVFLATLFGIAVASGVDYLERFRIRRGVASALLVLGTLTGIGFGLGQAAPTLVEQGRELQQELPAAIDKVSQWLDSKREGLLGTIISTAAAPPPATPNAGVSEPATPPSPRTRVQTEQQAAEADSVAEAPSTAVKQRIKSAISGASRYIVSVVSNTIAVFGAFVLLVFLVIYIGAEPEVYRGWILAAVPAVHRAHARLLLAETSKVLRKWLVTQLIAMIVIGIVTTVGLLILDVRAAIALGFIAGLLEFIPTIGPFLSAVPAVIMGFAESPTQALTVAVLYWGIQFLENNLLIPWLMRGEMDLPPAITLVAQTLMTLVFGFVGLMVAVPLTAAVLVPLRIASERENARERALVRFARSHGYDLDPTPPLSHKDAERVILQAESGPAEFDDGGHEDRDEPDRPAPGDAMDPNPSKSTT